MSLLDVRWFALHVKPRHEKAVSEALRSKGYEVFLPIYEHRHRSGRTYRTAQLPLFESGLPLECCAPEEGDLVEIVAGPLRGLQGVLLSRSGRSRFLVSITLLHRSVSTEVDLYVREDGPPGARLPRAQTYI
jgi:transcription antitermination factor NusG